MSNKTRTSVHNLTKRAGKPPIAPVVSAQQKSSRADHDGDDHPGAGVALALLKYFYWIEIGIRSYLRSQDDVELSRSEGLVIASIMLGYSRPSDIARQQGVSRQATHATIRQMLAKGIVKLIPDPTDGRIKLVALTELAHKLNADGVVAMDYLWRELGRRIGRSDLNQLAAVMNADWGPPIVFDHDDREGQLW